jgi:hypothetical protein
MAPPKVGAPTVATQAKTKRPPVAPVFEETPRASTFTVKFSQGLYTTKKRHIAPQVRVPTDGKYPLVTPKIPPGVIVEGDMLGKIVCLEVCRP